MDKNFLGISKILLVLIFILLQTGCTISGEEKSDEHVYSTKELETISEFENYLNEYNYPKLNHEYYLKFVKNGEKRIARIDEIYNLSIQRMIEEDAGYFYTKSLNVLQKDVLNEDVLELVESSVEELESDSHALEEAIELSRASLYFSKYRQLQQSKQPDKVSLNDKCKDVGIGSTKNDVINCIGEPEDFSKIVTKYGVTEFWHYPKGLVQIEDGIVENFSIRNY